MRCATSFWNISVSEVKKGGQGFRVSQRSSSFRPDVVGQVGDDLDRACACQRRHVAFQRVVGHHLQPSGIVIGDFRQGGQASLVALDGDDLSRPVHQQCARQAAGPARLR